MKQIKTDKPTFSSSRRPTINTMMSEVVNGKLIVVSGVAVGAALAFTQTVTSDFVGAKFSNKCPHSWATIWKKMHKFYYIINQSMKTTFI